MRLAVGDILPDLHLEEIVAGKLFGQILDVRLHPAHVIVEKVFRALVGIVRTPQADGEQQRTVAGPVVRLVDEVFLKEHQRPVDAILVMRHPVALADAGVRDLLGGRPFAGAGFGERLGFALRILRRFISVPTADIPADALVPTVHLVRTGKVHLARADRLVAVA